MRYKTIKKFAEESGYSVAAVQSKIRAGVWLKDEVWKKAADGRILIDVEGYERWVEMDEAFKVHRTAASKSLSCTAVVDAASEFHSRRQRRT
jgi:hypothetical protein